MGVSVMSTPSSDTDLSVHAGGADTRKNTCPVPPASSNVAIVGHDAVGQRRPRAEHDSAGIDRLRE